MVEKRSVLFLCTGNACRSQMAEAILRHMAGDRFESCSAGSHPAGFVHPLAIEAMERKGISLEGHRSKSWDEFIGRPLDLVITVCDAAAGAGCPAWPERTTSVHWSLPDPANHPGTDQERRDLADRVADRLEEKITGMVGLDWSLDRSELIQRLNFLGEI